jgi:malate permease and related proteins
MNAGDFAAVLLPIYACVAAGYAWTRAGQPFDLRFIADFVYLVGAPALVLSQASASAPSAGAIAGMASAALLALAVSALIAWPAIRRAGQTLAPLPALALPLSGAMGLTVAGALRGAEGMALATTYFAVTAMVACGLDRAAAKGAWRADTITSAPALWAIAAAFLLTLTGWAPPRWVANTSHLLGGLVAPTLMLMMGAVLARTPPRSTTGAALGAARILLGGAVGLGLAHVLGLGPAARAIVVLQGAMPVEMLWAVAPERGTAEIAAWSYVFALIALPALVLALA